MSDVLQDEATPPGKRRLGRILLVVLLVVVALGLWFAWRSPADQIQGMADADTINVAAKITARVAELKVREGDRVQAGQVVFLLDSPEVTAKEQQARGALAAAQAVADKAAEGARSEDIRAAEANWKRAEAGATLAEATYRRVQNLFNEGVMTRQKRDEALAQSTSSRELARAARAQYDMALAGAREQDKRAAQGQVQQAQGAVAEVDAARVEVEGRAPVAGEINKRMADPGELVPAGYPVFTLVDIDRMWVSMNLRESQMQLSLIHI